MDKDNPQRSINLRQFIIDEDLNVEIPDDWSQINEADTIMASFQPMPFGEIIKRREAQVGRTREDVMGRLTPFLDAQQRLNDLAYMKNVNLDQYTGGDAEIDAAQMTVNELTESGTRAQKQMEQRDREQKIREEGFPVDITQLPSSQQPIAVGEAGASKSKIEAQERERSQQAEAAKREAAEAEEAIRARSGPRAIGGGLAV